MEQLEPTYIITGHTSHEKLIEAIIAYCEEHQECQYQVRPPKEYKLHAALAQLSSLQITRLQEGPAVGFQQDLSSEADHPPQVGSTLASVTRRGQGIHELELDDEQAMRLALLRLGCFTSVEAQLSLCAAGALLIQLEKTRAARNLSDRKAIMRNVECIRLSQHMLINADALTNRSHFREERRIAGYLYLVSTSSTGYLSKVGSRKGEFGMAGLFSSSCGTRSGSAVLKQWFQRPLCDLREINDRHQSIAVFHRSENRVTTGQLRKLLKRITGGVHKILNRLENMDPNDWKVWKDLVDIDFDSSRQDRKINIHAGVDPKMDELLALVEGLPNTLDAATDELLSSVEPSSLRTQLADISVHMMPQLGCLIQLQNGPERIQREIPQDWELQFHDDEGFEYFKVGLDQDQQLDDTLGDLLGQQADLTIDITEDLAIEVRKMEAMLLEIDQVIAELDCILAMTANCETFGLVRPRMVEENVLIIQKGRHILYEMANEAYIGNDTDMWRANMVHDRGSAFPDTTEQSLMLITGANGETVVNRESCVVPLPKMSDPIQVQARAHMENSYVPAEAAILGLVDKLYTRIQTRESTSKVASAFMIDLSQVSMMLRGATARSLLVLDEFGKGLHQTLLLMPPVVPFLPSLLTLGTLPQDGAGLFIGALEEFLSRGSDCPKIIAITHFHCSPICSEIFQRKITHIDFAPFAWQMKTHFQDDHGERDQLTFLFQLDRPQELSDLQSSAAECALHYGVSAALVERAKVVTGHVSRQEIGKIVESVEISPAEAVELSQAECLTRSFLKWDLAEEGDGVGETMKALKNMIESSNRISGDDV
ncbi:hypothetical protein QFC19_006472 [Naganishia cerealis]|uniref:Uncharacterized protein n=1 Tax=Naganishia cerealis TaxID=610337 RepID=A0ACC2VG53_9TREE|nr:hypothetical protein QFC19_006472 [Naganishia cerealis]